MCISIPDYNLADIMCISIPDYKCFYSVAVLMKYLIYVHVDNNLADIMCFTIPDY